VKCKTEWCGIIFSTGQDIQRKLRRSVMEIRVLNESVLMIELCNC